MSFILNSFINLLVLIFAFISFFYHNHYFEINNNSYNHITLFFSTTIFFIWAIKTFIRWKKLYLIKDKGGYQISNYGF